MANNFFKFFALGQDFDVDAYLETSPLRFDHVWHRGETKPGGIGRYPTHGASITLGDGCRLTRENQERIAIDFLERNEEPLRDLAQYEGVERVQLGIQFRVEASENLSGISVEPSMRLMYAALRIGRIQPLYFVDLVKPEPDQPRFDEDA